MVVGFTIVQTSPTNSTGAINPNVKFVTSWAIQLANSCHVVTINCAQTSIEKEKTWLLDSGASHNIMSDVANLSTRLEYDSTNEVILGNGLGLDC